MPKVPIRILVRKSYTIRPHDLLKAREAAGLSQEELEVKLNLPGWSQQNISNIESQLLPHSIDNFVIAALERAGFQPVFNL